MPADGDAPTLIDNRVTFFASGSNHSGEIRDPRALPHRRRQRRRRREPRRCPQASRSGRRAGAPPTVELPADVAADCAAEPWLLRFALAVYSQDGGEGSGARTAPFDCLHLITLATNQALDAEGV